jgi:cytochrome c2
MPPAKVEPGRDPEMAARTQTLNVVFALTSIGLLLAFSLMVWEDYNREWKKYQVEFNKREVKLTQAQIQEALGKEDAARRQDIQARLAQGRQEMAARAQDIRAAEREKASLDAEWYRVDQNYRFTKADIDVARYEYEEAVHTQSGRAEGKRKHLADLEQRWEQLRLQLQDVEARRAAAQGRLNELEKTRLAAEKDRTELEAQRTRLEARLQTIKPGFVTFVRNLPVLDLANPSLKINQIMPTNLKDDVIFTATEKVDRCTTCHLGIDKKGYEDAPQPFTTHPRFELYLQGSHPIEKIGCTACHQGRGRATSFVNAAHTPSTSDQEKAWAKYSGGDEYHGLHYWDLPMMARGHTEAQCVKCHQGLVEVPKADRLNTGLQLVERYGCYGCHKIKGWEGLRKVGPTLTRITGKTNENWIFHWIKKPSGFRPTRMPQIWDVRPDETPDLLERNNVEANAVAAYLVANAQPDTYAAPPAGDPAAGKKTFETVGCLGCHRVGNDRRGFDTFDNASYRAHGPNLEGTGSKVNAGWLYAWLKSPKSYWHDTRMPNLRLSDKEAADLVAFLMSLRNDAFVGTPRPEIKPAIRDAIVREHLIAANVPVKQADEQLAAMDDRQRTLFVGEKTIARYGCFGCHEIRGFEKATPIGAELTEEGSKLVDRLDFGYEHGLIPHTLPGWLKRKVEEPRIFDKGKLKRPEEMLRMPKFWVSGEEADTIVTGLMSFTKEQVPLAAQSQLGADDRYVQAGKRLVREYNCRGCHQVGDYGGAIREVVKSQLEASGGEPANAVGLSPPMLYNSSSKIGEGARVRTEWLHDFLADPSRKVRPWFDLRMPTFEFSEEQLNTLTRYFAAQDRVPYPVTPPKALDPVMVAHGRDLFTRWQCVKCHVVAGKLPNQEVANMAPDLARVPERLRPDWLTVWLADPQKVQPGTRMPTNFPANPQENAFPEILGGDQAQQIEAMRSYLLTLGAGQATAREGSPGGGARTSSRTGGGAGR